MLFSYMASSATLTRSRRFSSSAMALIRTVFVRLSKLETSQWSAQGRNCGIMHASSVAPPRRGVTESVRVLINLYLVSITLLYVNSLRAVVCDGVTVGHPGCGHHDCQLPLPTQRAKYCTEHSWEGAICCIATCDKLSEPGFQTCNLPDHRAMEKHGIEEHSAMFQLRKCLERRKATLIDDSMTLNENTADPSAAMAHDDAVEMEGSAVCAGKSDVISKTVAGPRAPDDSCA